MSNLILPGLGAPSAAGGALFQTGLFFQKKKTDRARGRGRAEEGPIPYDDPIQPGNVRQKRPDWIGRRVTGGCLK